MYVGGKKMDNTMEKWILGIVVFIALMIIFIVLVQFSFTKTMIEMCSAYIA